ncbi:LOW QUALITY PROTEIN: hypothetical protein ACHAW6_010938 [Cyclotella cf. meneghiniana]
MTSALANSTLSLSQPKCHSNYIHYKTHQNLMGTSTVVLLWLNYLGQTTRPDILYVIHQVSKYSTNPSLEHGEAII